MRFSNEKTLQDICYFFIFYVIFTRLPTYIQQEGRPTAQWAVAVLFYSLELFMVKRLYSFAVLLGALSYGSIATADSELHVYNWSDYIGETTVADFEKETGIKVVYDVYDSNEILEAKLLAGRSGYDVVFPTARPFADRQLKAGILQPL